MLIPEVNTAVSVDLSVKIGALRLRNPILAASGTFGYGLEFSPLVQLNSIGGFVTKGLSRDPMEGAPGPRLYVTPSGMLNAVGLQNIGVRAFVADKLPLLRKMDTAVIANVFGYTIDEYVEVIRVLEDADGLAAYELNISCPNVKEGGMEASVGKTLTPGHRYQSNRSRSRGSGGRRIYSRKYLPSDGSGLSHRKILFRQQNRRVIRSSH
jgi:hypothetical protein